MWLLDWTSDHLVPHFRAFTSFCSRDLPYLRWYWILQISKTQTQCQSSPFPCFIPRDQDHTRRTWRRAWLWLVCKPGPAVGTIPESSDSLFCLPPWWCSPAVAQSAHAHALYLLLVIPVVCIFLTCSLKESDIYWASYMPHCSRNSADIVSLFLPIVPILHLKN